MMDEIILSAIESLREELVKVQNSIVLIQFDIEQIRTQLDSLGQSQTVEQSSIGIAPNTPPPDFLPPELM